MKKIILLFAISVVVLSSCKKDYVCTCTDPGTGEKTPYTISTNSKALAKTACEGYSSSYGEDCSL